MLAGDAAQRMGGPAEALRPLRDRRSRRSPSARPARDPAHDLTLRAAAAANGSGRTDRAMALLRARLDTDLPTDHERAELLGALAFAARLTEERVDRLALTEEAPRPARPTTPRCGLRVGLLARRAEALMDGGAPPRRSAVADEAMALAVEHDLTVDRTDLASILARLSETAGDPGESIRRLEGAVAAWTSAPDLALLRAMHILASVHYRQGDHAAALAAFERTVAEARRAGLEWSVYGVDARAMAVTDGLRDGRVGPRAASVAEHDTEMPGCRRGRPRASTPPPGRARGTGAADAPPSCSPRTRPWWADDGRMAVQSGDRRGRPARQHGDVDRMLDRARRGGRASCAGCGAGTGRGRGAAGRPRDRATSPRALRTGGRRLGRHDLLAQVDRLCAEAADVWGAGFAAAPAADRGPGLAGAGAGRAPAGPLGRRRRRGRSTSLVARWREVVDLFEQYGERYEAARAPVAPGRGAPRGGRPERPRRAAPRPRDRAARWAPQPLLAALDHLAPRSARGRPRTLTAREAEVLGAASPRAAPTARSAAQLFISTKTASVHVSNILAKLGAASRGEAVALAARLRPARRTERGGAAGVAAEPVPSAQREDAVGQRRPRAGWPRACGR